MSVWERFDDIANTEEVDTAKAQFKPLEEGEYEAVLEKIEAKESKSGLPMLSAQFRTNTNQMVFYNQVLQNINNPEITARNIAQAVTFLEGVLGEDIQFEGLAKLAQIVESVPVNTNYTIEVTYGKNDTEKNFPKVKIIDSQDDPF